MWHQLLHLYGPKSGADFLQVLGRTLYETIPRQQYPSHHPANDRRRSVGRNACGGTQNRWPGLKAIHALSSAFVSTRTIRKSRPLSPSDENRIFSDRLG